MKKIILISMICLLAACSKREMRETKSDNGQLIEQYEVVEASDGSFLKDGFYKYWYSNGQIKIQAEYEDNLKTGIYKSWYSSGKIKEEFIFDNDSVNGDFKKWHENGKMLTEGKQVKGKLDGIYKSWYANGQQQSEENYAIGLKDGEWKYWDQDGKMIIDTKYKSDQNLTLIGSRWLDKDGDIWEFFEGNTYIMDTQNGARRKGVFSLDENIINIDSRNFDISFLSSDSICAICNVKSYMFGERELGRLQAKKIE